MSNQEQSLINIQAQVKSLLGVEVKLKFEREKIDYTYGTAIRFDSDSYSPEICRFDGRVIESVDQKDLLNAYAMAYGSIPADVVSYKGDITNITFLYEKEGELELFPDIWYEQESKRKGLQVEISGQYTWVNVNSATAYFFKPDKKVKIKISKELVWGYYTEDDWNFYSDWIEDRDIDHNFSEWVSDTEYHCAKQREIWKAEIVS